MRITNLDNEDSEYLYTCQVEDKHTGFIHDIEVYKLDDGFGFRINWVPVGYENENK